ncbi:hypothetical protein IV203_020244 [Nitzschia inconspicua]|uniref:Uncharacterized protein n=1 Tax=Nitzschia inconspicua TaxID=303405 RepID=A0A9K3K6E0_9STRA|nr:hypothetical protein IV203_020244 [Nitzschia inconspicua]
MKLDEIVFRDTPTRRPNVLPGASNHDSGDYIGDDSSRLSYMEDGGDHIFDDDEFVPFLTSSGSRHSPISNNISNNNNNGEGRVYEIDLNDENDGNHSPFKRGVQNRYGSATAQVAAAAGGSLGRNNLSVYQSMDESFLFEDAIQPPSNDSSLDIEQMWQEESYYLGNDCQQTAYDMIYNQNREVMYGTNPSRDPTKPPLDISLLIDEQDPVKPASELSMGIIELLDQTRQEQQTILLDIFDDHASRVSGEESGRTSTTNSTTTGSSGSSRTVKTRGAPGVAFAAGTAAGFAMGMSQKWRTMDVEKQSDLPITTLLSLGNIGGRSAAAGLVAMGNDSDKSLDSIQIGDYDDNKDDDASFVSASSGEESDDDEEKKLKQQILWAVGGAGVMALFGWAGKRS